MSSDNSEGEKKQAEVYEEIVLEEDTSRCEVAVQ